MKASTFLFKLSLRYAFAWRGRGYIAFVSWVSCLSMMLGVAALMVVLSVMNGFSDAIAKQLTAQHEHLILQPLTRQPAPWLTALKDLPVQRLGLTLNQYALLRWHGHARPIQLQAEHVCHSRAHCQPPTSPKDWVIRLHPDLMMQWGLAPGHHVKLILAHMKASLWGMMPTTRMARVQPQTHTPRMLEGRVPWAALMLVTGKGDLAMRWVDLKQPWQAEHWAQILRKRLGYRYRVSAWTDRYRSFFHALGMQKLGMAIVLGVMVLIAVFSMVSSTVMLIMMKERDIAILRTCGVSRPQLMLLFLGQSFWMTLLGLLMGVALGLVACYQLPTFVAWLQHQWHWVVIDSTVYGSERLPMHLLMSDLRAILGGAFVLSMLGAAYPARRAMRLDVADILRGASS